MMVNDGQWVMKNGFPKNRDPNSWMVCEGKWMMTRGSAISGNLRIFPMKIYEMGSSPEPHCEFPNHMIDRFPKS